MRIQQVSLKAFAIIVLTVASIEVHAKIQPTNWPTVKTCGQALNSSPIDGHIWAGLTRSANFYMNEHSIVQMLSTDKGKATIKTVYDPTYVYNVAIQPYNDNELIMLSDMPHVLTMNVVNHNEHITSFSVDENQFTWYYIAPLAVKGIYRVLATDKDNYLYLLDISITDKFNIQAMQQIPESAASIGSISSLFYLSPDGNFVAYGYVNNMSVYSAQYHKVIVSSFHVLDNDFARLSWSATPQTLAFSAVGSIGMNWAIYSVGYDGSAYEVADLKPLMASGGFDSVYFSDEDANGEIIGLLSDTGQITTHLFILDVIKHQIMDTCIDVSEPIVSWIDSNHFYVRARTPDSGQLYSLIVDTQTHDYYKITYPSGIIPLGWVSDNNFQSITPTP